MPYNIHQLEFFFTHKIWFINEEKFSPVKKYAFNTLRKLVLTAECYLSKHLNSHASALTYSTILATVPILAIIFAIGRGLGYGSIIEEKIKSNLSVNQQFADMVLNFINSYLEHTQSGIFIGFGLLLLLYTVVQLTANIEIALNSIWNVKNQRSIYRQITDYISVFLLLPILIIISSGLSIFLATIAQDYPNFMVLSTTVKILIKLSPYALSGLLFTALYMYMPNTDIRFRNAGFHRRHGVPVPSIFLHPFPDMGVQLQCHLRVFRSLAHVHAVGQFLMDYLSFRRPTFLRQPKPEKLLLHQRHP